MVFIHELAFLAVEFIFLHLQCRYDAGQWTVCFNISAEQAEVPDVVRSANTITNSG